MNIQTEVFRGYGKIASLSGQTAVESRFGGEVETVIASHASVILLNAQADNGAVHYTGRVHFLMVYEDTQKHICRAEKGVEFSARIADERVFPALTARVNLNVENVSLRREGVSIFISALIGADVLLYGEQLTEYLTDGDCILKRDSLSLLSAHLLSGTTEADDEFDTDFIGDILLHSECVFLNSVCAKDSSLQIEGDVNLGVLALKGENSLVSFERLIPFRIEIPCDIASDGMGAEAKVSVSNVSIHADADEDKGRCRIGVELILNAEGCVYEETQIDAVTDAFSATNELALTFQESACEGVGNLSISTERITGKAALSSPIDFSDSLQAVILQRAEANFVAGEGTSIEGVAAATLVVLSSDGTLRGIEMSMPFASAIVADNDAQISVLSCGMSARQRQEGEIDAEVTLKIGILPKHRICSRHVASIEEGAPITESDAAISVYLPHAGDGLWELSKSLKKPPEQVAESNPDIQFPIGEGQRVVIYRKKTLN